MWQPPVTALFKEKINFIAFDSRHPGFSKKIKQVVPVF